MRPLQDGDAGSAEAGDTPVNTEQTHPPTMAADEKVGRTTEVAAGHQAGDAPASPVSYSFPISKL